MPVIGGQALFHGFQHAVQQQRLATLAQPEHAQQRGRLPWPLKGPLLARYGEDKADPRLSWKGLWIGADEGTPVRAVARGRVAYTGWMSRYGLIVVLEHENGYLTLYGHAATSTRSTGETVAAGDVIATAGDTGGYDKPGLYFEIRKGTDPLNPRDWLRPAQ